MIGGREGFTFNWVVREAAEEVIFELRCRGPNRIGHSELWGQVHFRKKPQHI